MSALPRQIIVVDPTTQTWGRGDTIDLAVNELRKQRAGGKRPRRYVVFDVPHGCVVDEFGRFTWWPSKNGGDDMPPRELGYVGFAKPNHSSPERRGR